ncbi:U-box domain-containing protein 26-like [Juglans microcarpa x Juglans regia]|uniref:U-box domain-containing protein 26-like n=1 Tax=Juglans microcarpa x Juglans regia TaxID=2249226 RepID=UPI001B7EBDCB|nr:U-box domain-containing protein 26-like [Juglans microcarpa x Juglans regia]
MPGSLEPLDLGVQIPYHFMCPISLELMRDPVTLHTGQTYNRASIESWVATGNTMCPVTRTLHSDFTLVPNSTLRRFIQDWCVANRSLGIERIPTPKQPANTNPVRSLLIQASSESNCAHSCLSALRRLKRLAHDSDKNNSVFSSLNASKVLTNIVFSSIGSEFPELNHEALALLVIFPLTDSECTLVASDGVRVAFLSHLLRHSSIKVRVNLAALIEIVVFGTRFSELRAQYLHHTQGHIVLKSNQQNVPTWDPS